MMQAITRSMILATIALAAMPILAQPAAGIPLLAQMSDRCMAAYAVRMVGTGTPDEAIYEAALAGCKGIDTRLKAAVRAQIPAAQAEELIGKFDSSAKPNFMAVLARIRSDRAQPPPR